MSKKVRETAKKIPDLSTGFKAMIGFDGYVDEIIHVVDKKTGASGFRRVKTISDYARKIQNSAGLSTNIELVKVYEKLGGNGQILANALGRYSFGIKYIGCVGKDAPHLFLANWRSARS
jgi:sugar/nucleoside kinase (ribokinase family)